MFTPFCFSDKFHQTTLRGFLWSIQFVTLFHMFRCPIMWENFKQIDSYYLPMFFCLLCIYLNVYLLLLCALVKTYPIHKKPSELVSWIPVQVNWARPIRRKSRSLFISSQCQPNPTTIFPWFSSKLSSGISNYLKGHLQFSTLKQMPLIKNISNTSFFRITILIAWIPSTFLPLDTLHMPKIHKKRTGQWSYF